MIQIYQVTVLTATKLEEALNSLIVIKELPAINISLFMSLTGTLEYIG